MTKYDRAKRNHNSSIFNIHYSFPASPGWVLISLLLEQTENFR
ncbi:hypothetical protein D1AOALGA4SA_7935 [Olavius algarvensis Delta 1 endosymbiont]|nr:hypothetical protein D1AOALGA4SA_7935 [Olavius algarvensis Delta 1 endosymbiont]